ncbi:LapA family protein [Maledivibacter halophilus]|uniref:Uncharacterized integral membrane protein n=1 Tax=Maledivibacter halophilus TaxID=36842 RepID=A0A1T5L2D9_9FIRM|nr:LapA family protein [Maledivibacter halophilus]SKC70131.1 Uncharacterized integral membrane protein [Maledivibacter halophilus]
MQILFILSLVFAILVSIFAVMNSDPVTIKLLWKQFEFSQAIVILGSAVFGATIVAFLGIFSKVKSSLKIRELQNKIKKLEKEIESKSIESNDTTINEEVDKNNNTEKNKQDIIKEDIINQEINVEDDREENV